MAGPRQKFGFATSWTLTPFWYDLMVNGPEPTVSVSLAYFDGSACFSQTCFGTIGSSNPGFDACGAASVSSRVDGSLAVTLWTFSTSPPLAFWSAGLVLTALKVQATSSAVSGWLSDHFMPSRMW